MERRVKASERTRGDGTLDGRLVAALTAAAELLTVYVGDRLGLYRLLAERGSLRAAELAEAAGIAEPYAREWLAQQAAVEIVAVEDPEAEADVRRYALSASHATALTNVDDPTYTAPVARLVPAAVRALPALLDAFRRGGGVPYVEYGADAREALADLNRPRFQDLLPNELIGALPDIASRLGSQRPVRIADVGCGAGWSAITFALAYPGVRVEGFDSDEASIDLARANARASGVSERVRFHVRDLAERAVGERYDLVWGLATWDGAADPVGTLGEMRRLAAGGEPGAVVVMSLRSAPDIPAEDSLARLLSAASVLFLLPIVLADRPAGRTATFHRAESLAEYATEAGYARVEALPIEHRLWRFHRLHAQ